MFAERGVLSSGTPSFQAPSDKTAKRLQMQLNCASVYVDDACALSDI